MNLNQFLLFSIQIDDKHVWSEFVSAMGKRQEAELLMDDWESFDKTKLNYTESEQQAFDYKEALQSARNIAFLNNKSAYESVAFERMIGDISLSGRESSLLVDLYGNFIFVIKYDAVIADDSPLNDAVKAIFSGRNVINNFADGEWFSQMQTIVPEHVSAYVNHILGEQKLSQQQVTLNPDAAFPLLFSDAKASTELNELFANEENVVQINEKNYLASGYDNAFFHVGWNYTLAANFPKEVNENIFVVMTKMQMSYYKFRHFKEFFEENFDSFYKDSYEIDSEKVDFFDRLQLRYYGFVSDYYKFKLGLFPKYHDEMDKVEKLWHIDQEMELMDKTFAAQSEYVNKRYNALIQDVNDKQNQSLNFIALLQIAAFISVLYDSFKFSQEWPLSFTIVLFVVIFVLAIATSLYFSIKRMKNQKKINKRRLRRR